MEEQSGSRRGSYAKRGRFWAVTDAAGQLICLTVYKKGAQELLRRLGTPEERQPLIDTHVTINSDVTTERGEER